jgi:RNA polymerase sigma factor (sigma-70 family)
VGVRVEGVDGTHTAPDGLPRYVETPSSFEDFYDHEYPKLVRLLAGLTGRWALAEELAQDSFLVAHRRWSKVSTYESPSGWLRRIATNRARSVLRRRAVEARVMLRLRGDARMVEAESDVESAAVWRAVAKLPKRQAQVIALRFYEDRSVADIALILECGEDTVRTHLRRGRERLANKLGFEEPDE